MGGVRRPRRRGRSAAARRRLPAGRGWRRDAVRSGPRANCRRWVKKGLRVQPGIGPRFSGSRDRRGDIAFGDQRRRVLRGSVGDVLHRGIRNLQSRGTPLRL
jgi:hypothetical protein